MGDITGPISSLPGTSHDLPDGATCDVHPDRPAVARIQGETDSMGCELHDCCEECVEEIRSYERSEEARTGTCDWCSKPATDLAHKRDYEEGMNGPVYRVCKKCRDRREEEDRAELDRYGDYDEEDYGDYDD